MKTSMRWAATILAFAISLWAHSSKLGAAEPAKSEKLTAQEVIELWTPLPKVVRDFGKMGGSPEGDPKVAAYSFRAIGGTYEKCWNFYAELCGIKERFSEKAVLVSPGKSPKGSYVVSDRVAADGSRHAVSVFLLKTDQYTVTVTLHSSTDGKSIEGSLTAVVP
jgi:hypothetical protein